MALTNQTQHAHGYPSPPSCHSQNLWKSSAYKLASSDATKRIPPPDELIVEFEISGSVPATARKSLRRILHGRDDRLVVVIGPCSAHNPDAAMEYARLLAAQRERFHGELLILMRVCIAGAPTEGGWKGLIHDPYMDSSFCINEGLRMARSLLRNINELGVPIGTEFLDLISPHYTADLISWGTIHTGSTESQAHRELASSLPCPIAFQRNPNGDIQVALDAIQTASKAHHFISIDKSARVAIISSSGNDDCHLLFRDGTALRKDFHSIRVACQRLADRGLHPRVMIDTARPSSPPAEQVVVCQKIANQIAAGDQRILGVVVGSNLVGGQQDAADRRQLVYGQSVTDSCIGWYDSVHVLETMARAVVSRRSKQLASHQVTPGCGASGGPHGLCLQLS